MHARRAARLEDEPAKELVLQAGLRDGEVDDGDARRQLRREVRVGQPRRAEQPEGLRVVHLPPGLGLGWPVPACSLHAGLHTSSPLLCIKHGRGPGAWSRAEPQRARLLVGELHGEPAALARDAAVQHRVQHRVQLLLDVLNQQRPPLGQAVLRATAGRSCSPEAALATGWGFYRAWAGAWAGARGNPPYAKSKMC